VYNQKSGYFMWITAQKQKSYPQLIHKVALAIKADRTEVKEKA
jgi:hypothetical protein